MTLRTLNYENYGRFLKMGNAGFCPSTGSLSELSGLGRVQQVEAAPLQLLHCPFSEKEFDDRKGTTYFVDPRPCMKPKP